MIIIYNIEISKDAEKDIINSVDFYEQRQKELGKRFFRKILKSFDVILLNPYAHQKIDNNLRKYTVEKFPFIILYRIATPNIRIIAVFHTSRNPETIKTDYKTK